jgi:hypothetical protein
MDYGRLIAQAWATTWRYRFLWVLGILAGGGVGLPSFNSGSGTNWQLSPGEFERFNPAAAAAASDFSGWATANIPVLVAAGSAFVLLLLTLFVLSFVAQGGMAQATADLAIGRPTSFGGAWHAGLRLFWRYVGLWLLLIAAAIGLAIVTGAVVGTLFVFGQQPAVAVALGVLAGLAVLVLAIPVSITVAFAQRAIAVEDVGPLDALRIGMQLLRAHLGDSLLAWLVNIGLAIGSGIVLLVAVVGVLLALGGVGALIWSIVGFTTPTLIYIGAGTIVFLALGLLLAGVGNTFFWNYWTLAYLRLSRGVN